ncbi:hypothetical protein FKW77_000010 [Venturia effusa]|uniref:Protein kinase domain-containing protein n=1 Tax=Venturia effusa TaxID=50376 RepID=A0A517L0L4_9PEZI|nr:hypothetical protein FKW77_000010 [Venturia effusa]
MEAYGGFQSRNQARRMAHLYSDSKKPADRVMIDLEPVPELVALHKEFVIQRERLGAWGKEWGADSFFSGKHGWDDTIEREGLKEAVHDVLENVKNVLDESERMSTAANLTGDKEKKNIWGPVEAVGDRRWSPIDRARYEQLAGELRTSIDLLYDISKNRKELRDGGYPGGGKSRSEPILPTPASKPLLGTRNYSESQETLVNPVNNSRSSTQETAAGLQLPTRLDPASLDLPEERPPPYESFGAISTTRVIAHLRLPAPPSQHGDDSEFKTVRVLVEYSPFDAGYRSTGVPVPTNRLDAFMKFFGRCGPLHDFSLYGTLQCLGYFEDPREARYGLVYELPKDLTHVARPTSLLTVLQSASKSLNSSNRQLPPGPPLEDRFRLAFNVMRAFSKVHIEILHKDVNSSNIVFFHKEPLAAKNQSKIGCDIRTPYISSFDLFSEYSIEAPSTAPGHNLYRHPEDPRIFNGICGFCSSRSCKCPKSRFDVYGLGLLLLEIGHWTPLSDLFKARYTLDDFKKRLETIWVSRLASKCGTIYMSVVRDCLEQSSQNISDEDLRKLYTKWLGKLQKCCLIDDDNDDFPVDPATPLVRAQSISGTAPRQSPENVFFPLAEDTNSASEQYSINPFMQLHAAPAPPFNSNNPFTRGVERPSHQILVSHTVREEHSYIDKQQELASPGLPVKFRKGDARNISLTAVCTAQRRAAQVILRAWRCRGKKYGFQEFKRRITLIQMQWRRRQLQRPKANSLDRGLDNAELKIEQEVIRDRAEIQITEIPSKPKLRLHPIKLAAETLDLWHSVMLPRLERIVEKALRDSNETVSIDLIGVGETALSAKATIFITCSSTARVRGLVNRKFIYDNSIFDLRVRKGKIRRSKVTRAKAGAPPHRSMMSNQSHGAESSFPLNPFHQERPLCGASIGAYIDNKHLPPVSFGGIIRIDDEPYGMTVHHLLDAPSDDDDSDYDDEEAINYPERSSARRHDNATPWLAGIAGNPELQRVPTDLLFPLEISDDDEASSEEELYSEEEEYVSSDDWSDNESVDTDDTAGTRGDLRGVVAGSGKGIYVTQPALDDVKEDFFPREEDKDDDHLDSHKLGFVYASSGIRRWNRKGIKHEIDWALLKLEEHRLQPYNLVQGGKQHLRRPHGLHSRVPKLVEPICRGSIFKPDDDEYPVRIAKTEELGSLHVHCFGRTSGLQTGVISEAMSSVRIYQRSSFSRSWNVVGGFGVGGDSGAWVIDNEQGRVCGHVLAWCERNAIAYICPMEVLLEDIGNSLHAEKICLPGCDEEDVISSCERRFGNARSNGGMFTQDKSGAKAKQLELPDIARLDFGDKERLGLGKGGNGVGPGLIDVE